MNANSSTQNHPFNSKREASSCECAHLIIFTTIFILEQGVCLLSNRMIQHINELHPVVRRHYKFQILQMERWPSNTFSLSITILDEEFEEILASMARKDFLFYSSDNSQSDGKNLRHCHAKKFFALLGSEEPNSLTHPLHLQERFIQFLHLNTNPNLNIPPPNHHHFLHQRGHSSNPFHVRSKLHDQEFMSELQEICE